jgi:hypothetical protein
LLRRKTLASSSPSYTPLHKSPSFSGEPDSLQSLDLEPFPLRNLVRTRSETFVSKLIFDPTVVQPRTPEVLSPTTKLQITTSAPPSPSSSSSSVATSPTTQASFRLLRPSWQLGMPLWCWLHHYMPCPKTTRLDFHSSMQPGTLNAQQHVDKMNDYLDLQEVDEVDVQMRLFAQSLTGDVKKWFKALPAASIPDLVAFQRSFLDRWEVKKNPLQILSEYENIKEIKVNRSKIIARILTICIMQSQLRSNLPKVWP